MRRFSSYGPIDKDVHYYAPREELIDLAYTQLMGDNPRKSGHSPAQFQEIFKKTTLAKPLILIMEIVFPVFVELSQEEAKPLEQEVDRSGIKVIVLPVGIL